MLIDPGDPPAFLGRQGAEFYSTICQELINANVLQATDLELVAILADQYEDYFQAIRDLKKTKYIIDYSGKKSLHPAWKIKNSAAAKIISISEQLGLSPSARQRIKMTKENPKKKKSKAGGLVKFNG